MKVRVRFAPSPTGMLHLGGARTALFNWLFARSMGGDFILRIEDTDRARFDANALEDITSSLKWLGLDWDEGPDKDGGVGPYIQSERQAIYQEYTDLLVEKGYAYRCYCTPEELDSMRQEQKAKSLKFGYDGRCRNLQKDALIDKPYVIRFKMPTEGNTEFEDAVRGKISYPNHQQTDFVIMKSDGFPTYHLACVVDDHLMKISHVLRGDEWIPSTPKHVCLYKAFGWDAPVFAHLPVILAPGGGKLSKRHGAASVFEYRQLGYLPDALVNFLTLLGWSVSGDNEIVDRQELISNFILEKINKTGAQFDREKLNWMNGTYIRELPLDQLAQLAMPYLLEANLSEAQDQPEKLQAILALLQPRLQILSEIADSAHYFFSDELEYDPKALKKFIRKEGVKENMIDLKEILSELSDFQPKTLEKAVSDYLEEYEKPMKKVLPPLRIAVTGRGFSPDIFTTLSLIGTKRVISRLDYCIENLFAEQE